MHRFIFLNCSKCKARRSHHDGLITAVHSDHHLHYSYSWLHSGMEVGDGSIWMEVAASCAHIMLLTNNNNYNYPQCHPCLIWPFMQHTVLTWLMVPPDSRRGLRFQASRRGGVSWLMVPPDNRRRAMVPNI